MISITFNADTPGELQQQMAQLLAGTAIVGSTAALNQPNTGNGEMPKRPTAAEKKAAEQAAKEAAVAAEAAAKAVTLAAKETAQQDAKDEAADQPAAVTLTQDSVRAMLGLYVQAFGMAAAQEDGPKVIGHAKISEIPTDQPTLALAVLAIANAVEKNPHKRDLAGDGIDAAKVAELKPIVDAARAVK